MIFSPIFTKGKSRRAYTLIEALVASSVLMIGIGAAASLSLTLLTQEEINERSARAANYLECVASLYYMGMDTADIEDLLPEDSIITNLAFSEITPSGTDMTQVRLAFRPSSAAIKDKDHKDEYVGGDKTARRVHKIRMIRGPSAYDAAP